MDRFRHIAVEGPIGAGKTSLARRLADRLDADLDLLLARMRGMKSRREFFSLG